MRKFFMWALRALLGLAIILGGLAIWKKDDITRLLAVNSLFSEEKIVNNFSHVRDLFFNTLLELPEGPASPLPANPMDMPDLSQWVESRAVTGLVVLKDG